MTWATRNVWWNWDRRASLVVTNDTPMLDPMLRMTLYRLVAYPVSTRGMAAMVSVVRVRS